MKELKGLIAFIVLVIFPLAFWVEGPGVELAKQGYIWIAFLYAPVSAAIFAYIVSGKQNGKVVGNPNSIGKKDDQGGFLISRFWGVFSIVTVAQIVIAFFIKAEI